MPEKTTSRPDMPPNMPEETGDCDAVATCQGMRGPVILWSLAAALGMIASTFTLELTEITGAAEFAVAMVPIPLLAGMYWAIFRVTQNLDEMQRQMRLEALGLTVIIASLIFYTLGQLERISIYEPQDFSDAWLIITFTFMACYGLVSLRYRT